jgi:hypothetical protein
MINQSAAREHFIANTGFTPTNIGRQRYIEAAENIRSNISRRAGVHTRFTATILPIPDGNMKPAIDILVKREAWPADWVNLVGRKGLMTERHSKLPDADIYSFQWGDHVVNFHLVRDIDCAAFYHRYSGVSDIINEIIKPMDFTLSEDGLSLNIEGFGPKTLSSNPTVIGVMLGLDLSSYYHGAENKRGIWGILTRMSLYNKETFAASMAASSVSATEKPLLAEFSAHAAAMNDTIMFDPTQYNGARWANNFRNQFPEIVEKIVSIKEAADLKNLVKTKFNETIVSEITGLSGDNLNLLMRNDVDSFKSESEFNTYILSSLPDTIKTSILDLKSHLYPDGAPAPVVEQVKLEPVKAEKPKRVRKAANTAEERVKKVAGEKSKKTLPKKKTAQAIEEAMGILTPARSATEGSIDTAMGIVSTTARAEGRPFPGA